MKIVKCILAIAVLFGICYVHSSEPAPIDETVVGEVIQTVVVPAQLPPQDTQPVQELPKKNEANVDDPYFGMHISPEEEYYTLMFARF